MGSKWVFAFKYNEAGEVARWKARLVAQGFKQRPGIDFDETYASVINKATIRTVFHIAAQKGMHLHQMDVKTAYLNGELEEEVYMRQPPGFEDSDHPDWVCKLKKSIYGLKQSARCWYQKLKETLVQMGFEVNPVDSSLFQRTTNGKTFYVLVYVDDLILAAECEHELIRSKKAMSDRFTMTDLGEVSYYLGLHVLRDKAKRTIFLHQRLCIQEILEKFNMSDCKPIKTPLPAEHDLTLKEPFKDADEDEMKSVPYTQLVGCIMYIMTCTRPDLAYAATLLSRFMADGAHRRKHWSAAKRVLRYLKRTQDHGIVLGGEGSLELKVAVDSSWADDIGDRKSTQGYVATLGLGTVTWKSQKSEVVALSTAEAEYYAAGQGGRETLFLRQLLATLGYPQC